jgi:YbbR domain-containing protein
MVMKQMTKNKTKKKRKCKILNIFKHFYKCLDKFVITPISRFIFKISDKFKGNPNQIERILNRPNILLYLSLVFAIFVFILVDKEVINLVENEAEIISNQPVTILYNKEAYVVEGLVDSVDIILTGNKSAIYLAKQLGEHEVVLDLTDYEPSDTPYKVKLTYNQTVDSISYKLDPTYVTVTIKNKVSKLSSISYDLLNESKLNEKLSVSSVELAKSEVVVKGSQDTLDKIATVKALVDLSDSVFTDAGTYEVDNIPIVCYDAAGNLLDNVEIVPSTTSATIVLDTYKATVPIKVLTTGDLVTGKAISSVTINGASSYTVDIYGEKSVIDKITSVPVTIDVSGLGNGGSKTYNVTVSKPNGVRYISETSAKIIATFGDEKQKTLNITDITKKNLDSNLNVNLTDASAISVQVKGVQSVIDSITEENVSAYIDLSGYAVGEYEVELKINNDDPRVSYVVTNKVKIKIVEK